MRVLDLSQNTAGAFCTLLLAELGADVIKVEPPAGDPVRYGLEGEFAADFLNRRKRSITLDLDTAEGRRVFLLLARKTDAVVETFSPGTLDGMGLTFRQLKKANSAICLTSISPFGRTGPRSSWVASELVAQAMGGIVATTGWDGEPPQKLPGHQAHYLAGLNAAIATASTVYGVRSGSAPSVHLDISIQESLAPHWARHVSRYVYGGLKSYRRKRHSPGPQGFLDTVETRDGWLYILALRAEWEGFAVFLGLDEFVTHEWADAQFRRDHWLEMEPAFRAALGSRSKEEWFTAAAQQGFTFAPIDDQVDALASPQLASREFFQDFMSSTGEQMRAPGLPFKVPSSAARPNVVPDAGQHTAEIMEELLGIARSQPKVQKGAGIV